MEQEEEADHIDASASQLGQADMSTDYDVTHVPLQMENLSSFSRLSRTTSIRNLDMRDEEDKSSVAAQRMTTHTKALLSKLKSLTENLVLEKQDQSQPTPSQGQ